NPLEQRAQRKRRYQTLHETSDGAARPDVDRDDVEEEMAVDGRRVELDVVDADDFAAVNVDDLLIEEVALEKKDAVGGRERVPPGGVVDNAHRDAGGSQRLGGQHPLAVGGFDDQVRDAGG